MTASTSIPSPSPKWTVNADGWGLGWTVYDFLGIRFGPWSKGYVSGLFLAMRTLASGTRLFVPSLVMVLAWQLLMSGGDTSVLPGAPPTSRGIPYQRVERTG